MIVRRIGTEAWMEVAATILCFRPINGEPGSKATTDDEYACILPPGHVGDCTFTNASRIETVVASSEGVRP